MYRDAINTGRKMLAVAPMMDWTDRHCRYFHRQLTGKTLLYTEMVVADAIIHGDRQRLIGFDPVEHPVALQVGGSEPSKLEMAACIGADFGYDEINLNVGCPSDRVQSGTFGACLMREPALVGECVAAMKRAVSIPVTVKCRLGVDDQDPGEALWSMARSVFSAGADGLWVHARKAWLAGLSPRENRDIPPLDYDLVYRLKRDYANRFIGLNGGVANLDEAIDHLAHVDGVMMGRAVYQMPAMLADADRKLFNTGKRAVLEDVVDAMHGYAARHIEKGGRLLHVTRHMTGLFHGLPGARQYRRMLAEAGGRPDAGADVIRIAAGCVTAGDIAA